MNGYHFDFMMSIEQKEFLDAFICLRDKLAQFEDQPLFLVYKAFDLEPVIVQSSENRVSGVSNIKMICSKTAEHQKFIAFFVCTSMSVVPVYDLWVNICRKSNPFIRLSVIERHDDGKHSVSALYVPYGNEKESILQRL